MEMSGNFRQILELGGTTIKGRRVGPMEIIWEYKSIMDPQFL